MSAVAGALVYALFVWWFATGLVLLLVLRQRRAVRASLVGAAVLFPVSLYILARSSGLPSIGGVYTAFTAAIVLWGTQEIAFLTGVLTGPRPVACPPMARGVARVRYALGAILYHELALLGTGLAVLAVTWGGANQVGALTFLVLYVLRVSAKLNLFLGVPVLNDSFLPAGIDYVRSYFRRGPVNAFFPVSGFCLPCCSAAASPPARSTPRRRKPRRSASASSPPCWGWPCSSTCFMLVQLPLDRLWQWSTRAPRGTFASRPVDGPRCPGSSPKRMPSPSPAAERASLAAPTAQVGLAHATELADKVHMTSTVDPLATRSRSGGSQRA